MNAADLPYDASVAALSEVTANAKIRAAFDGLILPNATILYASEFIDGETKAAFGGLLKLKTTDPAVVYRGLLIMVCSVLEYFCKQVIENSVAERASGASGIGDLSPALVASNFAYTGMYFQKRRDTYLQGSGKPTFEELAEGLMSCTGSDGPVKLNARVFTEFLGNCTPIQLETRFNELGLGEPFGDPLGGIAELKSYFGGGGARDVAKKSRIGLEELIERRNGLVHSSTISETVTVDEVIAAADFARALVAGLRELVRRA